MKKTRKVMFAAGCGLIVLFILWTVLVRFVDVRQIGPRDSTVGFAKVNGYVHGITGVNMLLYTVTDWLGIVPIGVAFCFAVSGFVQLIKRKSIFKVDKSVLSMGGFYIAVLTVYIFFEITVINYRPVLINGVLEASYPSSTTMLAMCIMTTAMIHLNARAKSKMFRRCISAVISAFIAFMVIGRLISGVHWFSDIIAGILISAGLVTVYASVSDI